jgi:hypothetical protein
VHNSALRLNKPPTPTLLDPYAQVKWMFHQREAECTEVTAQTYRYARRKYLHFLKATNGQYDELAQDPRFFLVRHWEADALVRFSEWLITQDLASKTRYSLYKTVRQVMDLAYALRVIDTMVYHTPVFKGVSETSQRSAYTEDEQEVINAAVARWIGLATSVVAGYTPTGRGVPYKGAVQKPEVSSVRALTLDFTVEGVTYPSVYAAATAYKRDPSYVNKLVRKGATLVQALGLEPISVPQSDERALLWMFENEFNCDATLMVAEFRRRKLGLVCTETRFRTLFMRWGVWPSMDDRIVMPLAVELAMLTGLNVESIKDLEIDSYRPRHPLTDQPVIYYVKNRSASSTRPADKELHLPLLTFDELFMEEAAAVQVERLIGLVLTLTQSIRAVAPEAISRKLFIFEDVELSRRTGEQSIVAIDPKRKAGHWYRRFVSDEALDRTLGASFNFNISRCRPTLVTNMVLAGADMLRVQAVLNHAGLQQTLSYLDEHQLTPKFNLTIAEALSNIAGRSKGVNSTVHTPAEVISSPSKREGFAETLSGCGCYNPFNPSDEVRRLTNYKEGSVCAHWNMCLFCDRSLLTERSLPKLMLYGNRVAAALKVDGPSIRSRKALFQDVIVLVSSITETDEIFSDAVRAEAKVLATSLDDVLVDQLIYQGL